MDRRNDYSTWMGGYEAAERAACGEKMFFAVVNTLLFAAYADVIEGRAYCRGYEDMRSNFEPFDSFGEP